MTQLASGISSSQLVQLDLRDCGITADGMQTLASAVSDSKSLQVLKLDENALNVEGAEALASALGGAASLEELHISQTSVGDEGRALINTWIRFTAHTCHEEGLWNYLVIVPG